jgi:hypothetical protein
MEEIKTSPQQPSWLVPTHPPLEGEIGEAAVNNQLLQYPKVVRSNKDTPISKQHTGLVSFMILKEPKKLANGSPLYGFFKLRGNWADQEQAESKGARIVREQDSKYKIRVVDVGEWLPLTDDDNLVKKNVNVNLDATDEERQRELAVREEQSKQNRIMKELKERQEEVQNARDYNDDKEGLDFYTMKRVVWLRMQENIMLLRNQISQLEGKLEGTRQTLRDLDLAHPEYAEEWIGNYNKERRKGGIPDYTPSSQEEEKYMATAKTPDTL